MGMGHAPACADVVKTELVEKVCPKEYAAFMEQWNVLIQDNPKSMVADALNEGDDSEGTESCMDAFSSLTQAFYKKTQLCLSIGFHDQETDGGRYDELDGLFWHIDNVYKKTSPAKRFEAKYKTSIERQMYTVFG